MSIRVAGYGLCLLGGIIAAILNVDTLPFLASAAPFGVGMMLLGIAGERRAYRQTKPKESK